MNKRVRNTIAFGVVYMIIKWAIIIGIGGALYKSGYWSNWYLLVIPAIGLTSLYVRRRMKSNKNKKAYVDN